MALTSGVERIRRGARGITGGEFGYPIAPNEIIWKSGLIGINSAGQLQRIQTAGTVAFVGLASANYDNSSNSSAYPPSGVGQPPYPVTGELGTYCFTVEGATFADIKATVYAIDDDTVTVTDTGGLLAVGMLAGIDCGNAYVKLLGT
jgi:hypothetical protein